MTGLSTTRWRVEVLGGPEREGVPCLVEEFDTYNKASDYARTWPWHDVRLSKIVEVAYFHAKERDATPRLTG